jgi:hypothetical protein
LKPPLCYEKINRKEKKQVSSLRVEY